MNEGGVQIAKQSTTIDDLLGLDDRDFSNALDSLQRKSSSFGLANPALEPNPFNELASIQAFHQVLPSFLKKYLINDNRMKESLMIRLLTLHLAWTTEIIFKIRPLISKPESMYRCPWLQAKPHQAIKV